MAGVLINVRSYYFRGCAGPARAAANRDGWNEAPPSARAISHNARALAKFERPKNACVFEGGRIWLSPHGRARAQARSSRGRNPRSRRRVAATQRLRACYLKARFCKRRFLVLVGWL